MRCPVLATLAATILACAIPTLSLAQCGKCGCDQVGYLRTGLAIEGDTLLGGGYYEFSQDLPGIVYVFEYSGIDWERTAVFMASDAWNGDGFGSSLDLSGTVALIGAMRGPGGSGHNGDSGAAYVFEGQGAAWVEVAKLVPNDAVDYDLVGASVSLSGDRALLGAPGQDPWGGHSGAAYLFERQAGVWVEVAKLVPADGAPDDLFGSSVALDGDVALVGAFASDDAGSRSGSAYVFEWDGASWVERAELLAGDAAPDDFFGRSVTISGTTAAIGAPGEDDAGAGAGAVYVFEGSAGWSETRKIVAGDGGVDHRFGADLALVGSRLVVGAPGHGSGGALYVHERGSGEWGETQWHSSNNVGAGDGLGIRVDSDGTRAFAGSDLKDCSGFVFDLQRGSKTWWVDVAGSPPGSGTPGDPFTSLAYALAQPAVLSGDRVLVAPGTYLDEVVDYLGKDVNVQSVSGPEQTILVAPPPGTGTTPVVLFTNGEGPEARLEGFTITGGSGLTTQFNFGGGVYGCGSSPTLVDCILTGNEGDNGGALFVIDSGITMIGCLVEANGLEAPCGGGLFFHTSTATVVGCTVRGNGGATTARGGGIYTEHAEVTFTDCIVEENQGAWGGGLFFVEGVGALMSCTVASNQTTTRGGGMYADESSLTIANCTIENNTAGTDNGGGAYLFGCTTELSGSTVRANTVGEDHWGGGLYLKGGTATIDDTTFEANFAGHGGGVHVDLGAADFSACVFHANVAHSFGLLDGSGGGLANEFGTVRVTRSVFRENRAEGIETFGARGGGVFGPIGVDQCTFSGNVGNGGGSGGWGGSFSSSIVWPDGLDGGATADYCDVQGGYSGTGNIDADPMLWSPLTGDFHLLPGSPCIDAGDPNAPLDGDGSITDMGALVLENTYCGAPASYCQAKVSSEGCSPLIGFSGLPSLTGPDDFFLVATDVPPNRFGLLIWSGSPDEIPFGGGTPRSPDPTPVQNSAGGGQSECAGLYSFHFSQQYMSDFLLGPFTSVFAQYWFRDPGFAEPENIGLTAGLTFRICP